MAKAPTLVPTLDEEDSVRGFSQQIPRWSLSLGLLKNTKFGILAFLVPLSIRSIPEIIAGPYPIGYDTIGSYVPLMLDWGSGNFAGFNPMIGGWLMFALFGLTYRATHLDPILIAKIAGPLLYGILGGSEYFFSRRVLGWDRRKSLLLVLMASFYFVSLRLSWDLFRNTLGTALLLLALALERSIGTRRGAVLFSSLAYLATITHLLAATLLVAFVSIETIRNPTNRLRKILCLVPAFGQYGLSLLGMRTIGELAIAGEEPGLGTLASLGYPAYIFLPIIPLALWGIRGMHNRPLKHWLIICVLGVALSATPLSLRVVDSYRWAIMMSVPIAVYATNGLTRLSWKGLPKHPFPRISLHAIGSSVYIVILLTMGFTYLALPVGEAFPYYRFQSPASMLQSTVPLEDSQYLVNDLNWLSANIKPGYVLMVHHTIYGWARVYFQAENSIIWFYSDTSLQEALAVTLGQGYSSIYTVWWNDGSIPEGFLIQHQEGPFGVFLYAP